MLLVTCKVHAHEESGQGDKLIGVVTVQVEQDSLFRLETQLINMIADLIQMRLVIIPENHYATVDFTVTGGGNG